MTHQPFAQGDLARTPLLHALVYVVDRGLTGTLELCEADGSASQVYFDGGVPSKVRAAVAPLDRVLAEMGLVARARLEQSRVESAELGVLHGEYLVGQGLIDADSLARALRWQMVRKVGYLMRLPASTRFNFYAENLMADYGAPELVPVEPLALILSGARLRGADGIVERTLAKLGDERLKLHPEAPIARFEPTVEEKRVIDVIRLSQPTLAELCATRVAPLAVTRTVVYALAITRAIEAAPELEVCGFDEAAAGEDDADAIALRLMSAANDFEKAQLAYRRGALAQAESLLRSAMTADPDEPQYLTLLAEVCAERRGLPGAGAAVGWYAREIALVDRALLLEPNGVRALYLRGRLHKLSGDLTSALADFERVRRLDPRHLDAAREIRLMQARAKSHGGERRSASQPGSEWDPAAERWLGGN
jgi:tetratricopeptide (TPR) repeat protein